LTGGIAVRIVNFKTNGRAKVNVYNCIYLQHSTDSVVDKQNSLGHSIEHISGKETRRGGEESAVAQFIDEQLATVFGTRFEIRVRQLYVHTNWYLVYQIKNQRQVHL
jgi:hypothetical protein